MPGFPRSPRARSARLTIGSGVSLQQERVEVFEPGGCEVGAMTVAVIPDQAGREAVFEPLLDELLVLFCPWWEVLRIVVSEPRYHRCEVKRCRLGEAAGAGRDLTRRHADLLIRVAMHDQCRSGIRQLILPLVGALGYRPVQSAIVEYVHGGTDAEKVGATMAWYAVQSPLKYGSSDDFKSRIPTKQGKAERNSLADLRDAYRAVCLEAEKLSISVDRAH
jgi:hypothetical protein